MLTVIKKLSFHYYVRQNLLCCERRVLTSDGIVESQILLDPKLARLKSSDVAVVEEIRTRFAEAADTMIAIMLKGAPKK